MKNSSASSFNLRRMMWIPILLATFTLALPGVQNAGAIEYNDDVRHVRFVPTDLLSLASTDAGWGNIAYRVQWSGEEMLTFRDVDASNWDEASIEMGLKSTGHPNCRDEDGIGRIGWPDPDKVRVDWTEDDGDAIFLVGNVALLRADQAANPTKQYWMWWDCPGNWAGGTVDRFNDPTSPNVEYFQVQIGTKHNLSVPWFSVGNYDSIATADVVPPGRELVPCWLNCTGTIQTTTRQPWLDNWQFSDTSDWAPIDAATANTGDMTLVLPDNGAFGWYYNTARVTNKTYNFTTGQWTDITTGVNTPTHFEFKAQCGSVNTGDCYLHVYMRTPDQALWQHKWWPVPGNGFGPHTGVAEFDLGEDDDEVIIFLGVETTGGGMWLDWTWVQPGL